MIAGRARGLRLQAPGAGTRPLNDRVKQTLFAVLEPRLVGAAVLDLFAGSGAAGIEALSRGADSAVFVERDPAAASVIEANLARTGLGGPAARVVRSEALAWLTGAGPDRGPYDVVIVDPPYAEVELLARVLAYLGGPGRRLLGDDPVVVAKHFWRDRPPPVAGLLASLDERRFGETALTFYRRRDRPEVSR